jgi:hypothetical protein
MAQSGKEKRKLTIYPSTKGGLIYAPGDNYLDTHRNRVGVQTTIMRLLLVVFCLLCYCGCASYYQPSGTYPVDPIREFSSKASVTLINGQPSTELVFFAGRRYANLNSWTDVALGIAERELRKRGLNVISDASKSLTMSIESAKTEAGWSMINTEIVMSAKTSDGYSATFTGKDQSVLIGRALSQMDKALMRVVVEMLNDPQIVMFLIK